MIAVALPSDDPILWILNLGGPTLGTAIVAAILISNIAIIGLLSYFAAVSIQQIKLVERMPWGVIIALTLTSAFVAAFNVDSTLSAVVAIANYQGMVLVGISAVCSADYLILRGQRLEIAQLYVSGPACRYWFWGGINWIAIIGVLTSGAIYLALYNPATLASSPAFRLFGASLPAYFGGGLVYILATLAIRRFTKAGGYVQSMPAKVAYVSL
jgi:NCS1 family nucleobase:cation symporter-1